MRTRYFYFPNSSPVTILRRQNKRHTPNVVEPELRTIIEVALMADNQTMEKPLQAPKEGYGEAIVIPEINADHFEIKTNLLQLVQANPYHGGNLLSKTTREALQIIENKSKVRYSRNKPNVSRMNTTSRENASKRDDRIDKLVDQISTLVDIFSKKVVTPGTVKTVEEPCVTCGSNHAYYNCDATNNNQSSVCMATGTYNQVAPQNRASNYMAPPGFTLNQSSTSGTLPSNTILNPKGEMKAITTRSGVSYKGPSIPINISPKKVVKRETEETTDKEQTNFQLSITHIQPPVVLIPEPNVSKNLPKPNIPYPLRLNDQKLREKDTNQMEKLFQMFQDLHFDISFADALLLMPKFASTIKSLLANKDKLFELAKIPLNENFSAMLLKNLPKKLRDPDKFLIPCDFLGMDEDYKPVVQSQRRVNPKIHEVIKKEVIKLLDAKMIYPISDSLWVSPIHCVPKKGGITVVENKNNELIPTRLVTGWRVCIDYRKLNDATRKDHFPLPFIDQMLERLAGNEFYCFLNGFSGYFQIPVNPPDQENTTFTCPYGTFAYRIMPFGLCNAPGTFQRFIQDFSKIARPMIHLLKKETPFVFSKDCIDAFETLKKKLTEASILVVPDWNLPFELMCDASDFTIDAVLQ
nr:reverse transcriptase domain-containing protein [Tanacetum cinerariifolium]